MDSDMQRYPDEEAHLQMINGILEKELGGVDANLNRVLERYDEAQKDRKENYYDMDSRERLAFDRSLREMEGSLRTIAKEGDHLRKLKDSPYFARIDFRETGRDVAEPLYIGRFNFRHQEEILIYDWRAPISSMFYDHDVGPAWYTAPDGRIEGELTLKRQFRIRKGQADYVTDTSETISDDVLQEELSRTSDDRMKTIIATIQREQNVVIRNEKAKVMLIQGAAGSGKTSIALHRIAFLLYRFRGRIKAEDVMILSPSKVFADYISDVIPELGEEPVNEYSFYELAMDVLDDVMDFEDPADPLDCDDRGWKRRAAFKSTKAFLEQLQDYVRQLPERIFEAADYSYDGSTVDADWIREQFLFYRYDPILERIKTVTDEVVEEYRYRAGLHAEQLKRGPVYNKLMSMLTIKSPARLYRDFYNYIGHPEMLSLRGGRLEWPDVFPFLYIWHAYHGLDRHHNIRHLIVDEMQDYTPVQYEVLNIMYPCNKTILGDYGQCLNPFNLSGLADLKACYPEAEVIELMKSYRSTQEIMAFAKRISPNVRLDVLDRHGEVPQYTCFKEAEEELLAVRQEIEAFRLREHSSLAVILRSGREAAAFYDRLSKEVPDAVLLTSESKKYTGGILVTSIQLAKGLEFDEVIVPETDAAHYKEETDRSLLYIACTRAMHRLTLTGSGKRCPLLP